MGQALITRRGVPMLAPDVDDGYEQLVNYTMLYDSGDECEEVTGGWVNSGYGTYTSTYGLIGGSINEDHLYCGGAGNAKICYVGVNNSVDLTDYSKLHAKLKGDGWVNVAFDKKVTGYTLVQADTPVMLNPTDYTVLELCSGDIENINQSAFIYVKTQNSASREANTYSVFLTKPDDIKTLCTKAGVTAPASLESLLADTTSLATIFNNEDAVKFMVAQCTGDFMVSVCNSATAMSALVNSIAYDYAFSNEHWYKFMTMIPTALAAMDSVAVTVPTMTSNTTPSGVASASSISSEGADAYKAFDSDNISSWSSPYGSAPPHWVQYNFGDLIDLYKIVMFWEPDSTYTMASSGYVSVSSNGVDYDVVYSFNSLDVNKLHEIVLDSAQRCITVRITITALNNTYSKKSCRVFEAQFYGKAVNE